jgi:hypothetical protein
MMIGIIAECHEAGGMDFVVLVALYEMRGVDAVVMQNMSSHA